MVRELFTICIAQKMLINHVEDNGAYVDSIHRLGIELQQRELERLTSDGVAWKISSLVKERPHEIR